MSEPDSDRRLAGVATNRQQFEAAWTALAQGQAESEEGWRTVVLPTLLAYSNAQNSKAHLELVTNLWLAARTALDDPVTDEELEDNTVALEVRAATLPPPAAAPAKEPPASTTTMARAYRGRDTRRNVAVAAVLAGVLLAAGLWWQRDRPATDPAGAGDPIATSGALASSSSSSAGSFSTAPSIAPVGAVLPTLPAADVPAPGPTWTGPGPASPPTAPHSLMAANIEMRTAALRWQPPVDPGTGGLAYYRILRDGTDIGWTAQSSVTVTGLAPATGYVFTVVAYNAAGLASPPSSPLPVTTMSPPASTGPPPAAATALVATTPASPIALGQSFTVDGSGWPCPGVTVEVRMIGRIVAIGTVNGEGGFTASVSVEPVDASTAKVRTPGSEPDVIVRQGQSRLEARPASPSACGNAASAIWITFS
jgi:hypothetical protein